jgi:CBS domain-containing protein
VALGSLSAGEEVTMNAVVKEVMSTLPISVGKTTSFKDIAARLRELRVSAFPVLDADGRVIGVVSEADLLAKEALNDRHGVRGMITGLLHRTEQAKAAGVTAADLMTSPAVTVTPDDTVDYAARLMYSRKVKRLPVVDAGGRPVGIVSRTDILAVFDRTAGEIRMEIMTHVIPGRSEPSWYSVLVKDGVVTLEGTPETVGIGHDIVRRARHVQGVVAVRDRLVYPVPPVPSRPGLHF